MNPIQLSVKKVGDLFEVYFPRCDFDSDNYFTRGEFTSISIYHDVGSCECPEVSDRMSDVFIQGRDDEKDQECAGAVSLQTFLKINASIAFTNKDLEFNYEM